MYLYICNFFISLTLSLSLSLYIYHSTACVPSEAGKAKCKQKPTEGGPNDPYMPTSPANQLTRFS